MREIVVEDMAKTCEERQNVEGDFFRSRADEGSN